MSVIGVILVRIFPHSDYLVRMRENADQNNSEYRHFLRSGKQAEILVLHAELKYKL